MADKGKFAHYMLKEIFEQPQGLRDTIAPRVSLKDGAVRLEEKLGPFLWQFSPRFRFDAEKLDRFLGRAHSILR